jgi:hypothetical protein
MVQLFVGLLQLEQAFHFAHMILFESILLIFM